MFSYFKEGNIVLIFEKLTSSSVIRPPASTNLASDTEYLPSVWLILHPPQIFAKRLTIRNHMFLLKLREFAYFLRIQLFLLKKMGSFTCQLGDLHFYSNTK